MKIRLIKHVDLDTLVDIINDLISEGYTMQGGIHSIVLAGVVIYSQTMVKND